jgi:4-hydroxy-3-methylbut-2-en-1-yl diphosphate reductase
MATITTPLRSALFSPAASSAGRHRGGRRRAPSSVRCDASPPSHAAAASLDPDFDKKAFRHNLTRSDNYNRKGFGHKKETLELMSQEYTSKSSRTAMGSRQAGTEEPGVCVSPPPSSRRLMGGPNRIGIAGNVIKTLKENGNQYTWGPVTVKLAEAYGFCWGVERAVQIAYEARKQFPEERIWLTNEIIHNPTVNKVTVSEICEL